MLLRCLRKDLDDVREQSARVLKVVNRNTTQPREGASDESSLSALSLVRLLVPLNVPDDQ